MTVECRRCTRKCEMFLCNECQTNLSKLLADMPWWLDRLAETSIGQARLGDPGGRLQHKSGLEKYADPKPVADDKGFPDGTLGERRLAKDLKDEKLRARLLAQGRVNAHASELFDEIQNMLGTWVRDVCEHRGIWWVPSDFIGPLRANEERETVRTAQAAAIWLRKRVSSLASNQHAEESYRDIQNAAERMERAVNRPPAPKTCGPCPTLGYHREVDGKPVFEIDSESRAKCGTRLEAKSGAVEICCPACKQTHNVEALTDRLNHDLHYMSFTIRQLLDVVLPRGNEHVPRRTLYDWVAKGRLKATGEDSDGTPKYLLADVRVLRTTRKAA